jgi:hypothetical protein
MPAFLENPANGKQLDAPASEYSSEPNSSKRRSVDEKCHRLYFVATHFQNKCLAFGDIQSSSSR